MILISGASGFIGSHLARALIARGKRLVLISKSGKFAPSPGKKAVAMKLNIVNKKALNKLPRPIEAVFHTAIHSSQKPETDFDLRQCVETNALGTLNLLEYCRDNGIKKFIYSSSIGVYGNKIKPPVGEAHLIAPETAYGIGKYAGELFCRHFSKTYGMEIFILRYSSVYGPGQTSGVVLPIFVNRARNGQNIVIFGEGKKRQDFVYIKDVVDANLLALESNRPGSYHIGSGVGSSMFALARTVKKIFGSDTMAITRDPRKPEDSTRIWLDISKAGKYLGYQPKFDLQRGLEDYKAFMES